jgi:hypothetical protein
MFDIWYELPTVLRAVLGLAMMGIAVLIWFATGGTMYAYGLAAVGLVFLLFCGAGNNSGGYKF